MRPTLFTLLAALVSLSSLAAQNDKRPPTAIPEGIQRAWTDFTRQNGNDWRVAWNEATRTPEAIWGPGLRLTTNPVASTTQARTHAQAVIETYASLLGQGQSRFVEVIGEKVQRVHVFVYRQRYRGLEVIDGRADVRIHDNGVLSLFGSQAWQIPGGFEILPKLETGEARARAIRHLQLEGAAPGMVPARDRLVIWADILQPNSPVRLAWEVKIDRMAEEKIGRAYIDARNGRFLQYRTDLHKCNFGDSHCSDDHHTAEPEVSEVRIEVIPDPDPSTDAGSVGGTIMAWTNITTDSTAALKNIPMVNMQIGSTYTDSNGKFSLPGTSVPVTLRFTGKYCGAITAQQGTTFSRSITLTGANNQIQIYTANAAQFDRSQSTCYFTTNRNMEFTRGILGNKSQLTRLNSIRSTVNRSQSCNAFYSGMTMTFFHEAGGCANTAFPDVIEHEWGHGLDDAFNGVARGEMQEGLADTVAIMQNDNPIIGNKFFLNRTPNYVRIATNTKRWPPSGSVHAQGEVWMGWCWDCRNELVTKMGKTAGVAQLRKLFMGIFVADPRSQQAGAREVALLDDNDGNLNNGTPNCLQLTRALKKRNIPNPIGGCAGQPGYGTFGMGCKGSGKLPAACGSVNGNGGTLTTWTRTNEYSYGYKASKDMTVVGFSLYTQRITGTGSMTCALYGPTNSAIPPTASAATGTMTVGASAGWYTVKLANPITVKAGQNFWVSQYDTQNIRAANLTTGTPQMLPTFWRRPAGGTGAWGTSTIVQFPSFRVNCSGGGGGGAVPALTNNGLPTLGKSFQVNLNSAAPNSTASLIIGVSKSSWASLKLPLDLGIIGAPGCSLLASAQLQVPTKTNASGSASISITIPNSATLVGKKFYNQYLIYDPSINRVGWVASNAGEGMVGNP